MEIDKLPPEVAEAIAALDAMTYAGSRTHAHWSYVKAHLHRLAEENARLKARFAEAPSGRCETSGYIAQVVSTDAALRGLRGQRVALVKVEG